MAKYVGNGRWSGKIGGWVYLRNGTRRPYVRRPAPIGRRQEAMRRLVKRLADEWRRLPPTERLRWDRSPAARRRHWSGYTAFVAAGLRRGRVRPRCTPVEYGTYSVQAAVRPRARLTGRLFRLSSCSRVNNTGKELGSPVLTVFKGGFSADGSNPLIHRTLLPVSRALDESLPENSEARDLVVRMSFLYSSAEWHAWCFQELCKQLVDETNREGGKPKNDGRTTHLVAGRDCYRIFAELNAFIYVSKVALDQSVALVAQCTGVEGGDWSIRDVCSPQGSKARRFSDRLFSKSGSPVAAVMRSAWTWGKDVVEIRDLMTHWNPTAAAMGVELASSDGVQFNRARVYLPTNASTHRAFSSRLEYGHDAHQFVGKTIRELAKYLEELMKALVGRR